jgi:sarcosine oxidase subunit gamma
MPEIQTAAERIGIVERIGPIATTSRLVITVAAPQARFVLRLAAADAQRIGSLAGLDLALPINRSISAQERLAARLGPDEWLIVMPEREADAFAAAAARSLSTVHHAMSDIGHRHVAFELAGAAAADVLASGCPLDLHRMVPGDATRTLFGKVEVILFRFEVDGAPAWRIECWRSFGRYLRAFLAEAARECAVG